MKQKFSDEQYELVKENLEKAQKNGDFKAKIYFAEKCGFYYYAGKISKLHGLFKRASENFKKIEENESLEEINEIIFPDRFLNVAEIQRIEGLLEICEERKDYGNWNRPFYNKIDDNLTNYLRKIQEPKYAHQKIKILN